ncbi:dihydrofolate reductase [bacterium]|nr:dihydrofolate reductase [bacterium]
MTVHLVAAMDEGRLIGRDNDLPWHLPADLKHFQRLTKGHPVVMGRRTWESVGKPLPNRTTIVVTRRAALDVPPEVIVTASVDEALARGGAIDTDVFVVGGAEIYAAALPRADRLHLTIVHARLEGDTRFPPFDESEWRVVEEREKAADGKHAYAMTFRTYARV